jgi:UDP-N-acetylglucosamine/UDP-N-acetylgalactosamine diphosphorylase
MENLLKKLGELEQEHIMLQIPDMSETHPIFKQLGNLDLAATLRNFRNAKIPSTSGHDDITISPVDKVFTWEGADADTKKTLENIGRDCIQNGKAAVVILSGGQGTRLGFAGPKGMYNMGLASGKSIFQLHIERIVKIRLLLKSPAGLLPSVPVYIMTSDMNDSIIRAYFVSMSFFGYPQEDVFFFEQGLEPCLTLEGKVIIDSPLSLSLAPDGNGGI